LLAKKTSPAISGSVALGQDAAASDGPGASSRIDLAVLGLLFLSTMIDGFDMQSLGFLAPLIAKTLDIDVSSFGAVFSVGMVGLALGSILVAQIADRVGRRRALIVTLATIGTLNALTAFIQSREQLIVLRFLTSLGLGGALPTLAALTAEHTPVRFRQIALCLLFAAIPAGGLVASLVGGVILPLWGWPSVFLVGGGAPILIALLVFVRLPSSAPTERTAPVAGRRPFRALFSGGRWRVTLPLWVAYFMSLLVLYFISNWIPSLLTQASLPAALGVAAIASFSMGGIVGTILQGPLLTRFGATKPVLAEFLVLLALVLALGSLPLTALSVKILTFFIGWMLQGAQAGLNAFTATQYSPENRTTALGWGLANGRMGSIIGAMLGGIALEAGLKPHFILLLTGFPVALGLAAFALVAAARRTDTAQLQ